MSQHIAKPFLRHTHRSLVLAIAVLLAPALADALTPTADDPLVVDRNGHVVVMEYEAWFGPNAVTFQGAAAH